MEQEAPPAPRLSTTLPAGSPVADLEISLVKLAVTQGTSQTAPGDNSLSAPQDIPRPATQDTSEATLQDATREAPVNTTGTAGQLPGNQPVEVDECVRNIQCAGNCEHIGCRIVKCEECSFTTDNKQRLESHIKESHRITCFTCKDTFRTFSEASIYQKVQVVP